ncbi:hypothetical protein [[Acholeplasma] multilocale]|uniref:hypothetical protein n=1 Tax=[Acholeplasma] multilocale TaxID=264638 RepID=UPI0004797213|nr:hypothetical protein [[Acholeplasma] multilocale]
MYKKITLIFLTAIISNLFPILGIFFICAIAIITFNLIFSSLRVLISRNGLQAFKKAVILFAALMMIWTLTLFFIVIVLSSIAFVNSNLIWNNIDSIKFLIILQIVFMVMMIQVYLDEQDHIDIVDAPINKQQAGTDYYDTHNDNKYLSRLKVISYIHNTNSI